MSILDRIADLGSAVKDRVGAALGDTAIVDDNDHVDADANDDVRVTPAMTHSDARQVLGVSDACTLDEVRAAADTLGRGAHAATLAGRPDGQAALDRIATAAELLEELLLPIGAGPRVATGEPPDNGGRTRATTRRSAP